jgi:plasmid replication initiation protein
VSKLQTNNLVAQSNKLIEGRYSATKNELLLLVAMISLISPKDKKLLTFAVSVNELANILNLDKRSALREFKKISQRLSKKTLELETPKGWKIFPWLALCELEGDRIRIIFNERLKPHLLDLKKSGNFTQYRLEMTTQFKSNYTIRMYQLLKEYHSKKIYKFEFSLEDFRKMLLGDNVKVYPLYKEFRKFVLCKAQNELSTVNKIVSNEKNTYYKSDLNFDLKTRRTGRKISHLIFTIKTQQTKPIEIPQTETKRIASNANTPQIIQDYEALGVMRKTVQPYLEQRGKQALINTLNKFHDDKENGKITKSEQGYLAHLLKINAGQKTTQKQQRQQAAKTKAEKEQCAIEEKQLKETFLQERKVAVEGFVASQRYKDKQILMGDFEDSVHFAQTIKNSLFLLDLYENIGIEDEEIKHCFDNFVIENHLDQGLNNFQQWQINSKLIK